jgi:hypothetical protein
MMPFIIAPPGLLLFAYTFTNGGSAYAAAVGYAMQVSALVLFPSVVLSIVVDSWPATSSEAMVLINAGKSAVAYGFTMSMPSWLAREGLVKMFWKMAAFQWIVLALAVLLYIFGPGQGRKRGCRCRGAEVIALPYERKLREGFRRERARALRTFFDPR